MRRESASGDGKEWFVMSILFLIWLSVLEFKPVTFVIKKRKSLSIVSVTDLRNRKECYQPISIQGSVAAQINMTCLFRIRVFVFRSNWINRKKVIGIPGFDRWNRISSASNIVQRRQRWMHLIRALKCTSRFLCSRIRCFTWLESVQETNGTFA